MKTKKEVWANNDFATKHGIFAKFTPPCAGKMDNEFYEELIEKFKEEFKPKTASDILMVQQLAFVFIRLTRVNRYHADLERQHLLRDAKLEKEGTWESDTETEQWLTSRLLRFHDPNRIEYSKAVMDVEKHLSRQLTILMDRLKGHEPDKQ
jgi:hypothetical protein